MNFDRLQSAWLRVREELLAERTPDGHWVGELSSSALSTATAVSALSAVGKAGISDCGFQIADLVERGIAWLVRQQNEDGGFGDTDKSYSNIATTYLVVAALHLAGKADEFRELLARAEKYIESQRGIEGLKERYGIDKTFVVPIMTNLALAGLVKWEEISPLPFELAVVPQAWYRFVGMPVVSYAIPALVAIGHARYHHKKPWNPITRLVRWLSITRSLRVLRRMQPDSGGYLEATPLTSFVVMSLASTWSTRSARGKSSPLAPRAGGHSRSEWTTLAADVIKDGVKFLANSIRPDGSWPIDTNLATWVTTLSINALAAGGEDVAVLLGPQCLDWLLSCQHTQRHPFTGADPGGWGWSNLSGAVPDADDTPGAVIACQQWLQSPSLQPARYVGGALSRAENTTLETRSSDDRRLRARLEKTESNPILVKSVMKSVRSVETACICGRNWLVLLQNRDGGWPTFCRGWGKLPFDRSGVDLTAHALRAINEVSPNVAAIVSPPPSAFRFVVRAFRSGVEFLTKHQHPDGSWSPLWFGNQNHPDEDNPVYGTAKVLMAYRDLELLDTPEAQRGLKWLWENQNADGGWGNAVWNKRAAPSDYVGQVSNLSSHEVRRGSPDPAVPDFNHSPLTTHSPLTSSVEETALAVEALLPVADREEYRQSVERGLEWLVTAVERGDHRNAAPIGFYFAKLWYYEKLYPIIFTASALGRACQQMKPADT